MSQTKRIVVISGGSRGLGVTLATEFASNDWHVVSTGRSPRPDGLASRITYHQFDASDPKACEKFWQQLGREHQDANFCLINNAGSYVGGGLTDADPEDFARQMQSVYFTSVQMTRGLTKEIPTARIINIISSTALLRDPNELAYGAAKAAQRHFFQTIQEEFKPEKYQITNLYPDYIATHGPDPDAMEPKDLAQFVIQLAESRASYYLKDATIYPIKR
jgi:3-oxoacyl-[acyl-carrier protein] reductase